MGVDYKNPEGYADTVPYQALTNIDKEQKKYRPIVYICSAFSGDVEGNTMKARAYSRFAVDQGMIPIAPHLLLPQFMKEETERDLAMFMDIAILSKCKELWVFGGVVSLGMAREIGVAKKRKMKIRWFDHAMKEVKEYA